MDAQSIINEIEKRVGDDSYDEWTIGVTDDPDRRKKYHKRNGGVYRWREWDAGSEKEARRVERHFIDEGMHGGTGGRGEADYVYIFQDA